MGLFASPQEPEKPEHQRRQRSGIAPALVVLLLLAVVLFPGYFLIITVATLIHERRRVRARWYLIWAATAFIVITPIAGGITGWNGWNLAQVGLIFSRFLPTPADAPDSALAVAATFAGNPIGSVLAETVASAPIALLTTAAIIRYRSLARAQRGQLEGETHSNQRPVGVLDRARTDRERKKIAAGYYLQNRLDDAATDTATAAPGTERDENDNTPQPNTTPPDASTTNTAAPQQNSPPELRKKQPQPTAVTINPADRFARPAPQPARTPTQEEQL